MDLSRFSRRRPSTSPSGDSVNESENDYRSPRARMVCRRGSVMCTRVRVCRRLGGWTGEGVKRAESSQAERVREILGDAVATPRTSPYRAYGHTRVGVNGEKERAAALIQAQVRNTVVVPLHGIRLPRDGPDGSGLIDSARDVHDKCAPWPWRGKCPVSSL